MVQIEVKIEISVRIYWLFDWVQKILNEFNENVELLLEYRYVWLYIDSFHCSIEYIRKYQAIYQMIHHEIIN